VNGTGRCSCVRLFEAYKRIPLIRIRSIGQIREYASFYPITNAFSCFIPFYLYDTYFEGTTPQLLAGEKDGGRPLKGDPIAVIRNGNGRI
jgi:hypothetical protein